MNQPSDDKVVERFVSLNKFFVWGLGLGLGGMFVAAVAALTFRANGPARTVGEGVAAAGALAVVAGIVLWVVGDVLWRRAERQMPIEHVIDLMDKKRWPEAIAKLEPLRSRSDPDTAYRATNLLVEVYAATGRNAEAEALARQTLESADRAQETLGVGLTCLATLVARQGRTEEAEEIYARALDVLRKRRDREATVFALRNVAWLYWSTGQKEEARQIYAEMPPCDPEELAFLVGVMKPFAEPELPRA